jgi:hypothetical protein
MVENLGWKKQTILKAVKLTQSAVVKEYVKQIDICNGDIIKFKFSKQ